MNNFRGLRLSISWGDAPRIDVSGLQPVGFAGDFLGAAPRIDVAGLQPVGFLENFFL